MVRKDLKTLETKITIQFKSKADVQKFITKVNQLKSDINAYKGSVLFDAKSLVSMMSIGHYSDITLEIITDNEKEIAKFHRLMKEFEV